MNGQQHKTRGAGAAPLALSLLAVLSGAAAAAAGPVPLPGARAVVIMGQSNALGQAALEAGDTTPLAAVQAIRRDGRPRDSAEPIGGAGYGFGRAFAEAYLAAHPLTPELWIVQCAVSGSLVSDWKANRDAYDVCRVMIHEAQALGVEIMAVLWHQGESNAKSTAAAQGYQAALEAVVLQMRQEVLPLAEGPSQLSRSPHLPAAGLPFIAGELGRFLDPTAYPARAAVVNQTRQAMTKDFSRAFVDSLGLTDKGDNLHFDHASQDLLGARYETALEAILGCGGGLGGSLPVCE